MRLLLLLSLTFSLAACADDAAVDDATSSPATDNAAVVAAPEPAESAPAATPLSVSDLEAGYWLHCSGMTPLDEEASFGEEGLSTYADSRPMQASVEYALDGDNLTVDGMSYRAEYDGTLLTLTDADGPGVYGHVTGDEEADLSEEERKAQAGCPPSQ